MYSVLIMGGSDFVGSSLAKHLIKNKYQVDIITRGNRKINYKGINKHLICDRENKYEIEKILKDNKYDYVYDISAKNKRNVETLIKSLDMTKLKKYILVFFQENQMDYNQEELKIKEYIQNSFVPYVIINTSNIYGNKIKSSKELYLFDQIENSIPIKIPKNNKLKTQFIYIDDLIKVLHSVIKIKQVREVYNVTNPQVISLEEYIKTCGEIIGKEPKIQYIDSNVVDNKIKEKFKGNYLDIDKVIQHGLYIPNILLYNGINLIYNWYSKDKQYGFKSKSNFKRMF